MDPNAVVVSDVASLQAAVANATTGETIALAPGTYTFTTTLVIKVGGVTLRSMTGNASSVILDGGGVASPVVETNVSNVTIASLTITNASAIGVRVSAPATGDITNDRIYDLTFADVIGPGIRIVPGTPTMPNLGPFADNGTIACSRFVDTTAVDHCTVPVNLAIDANAVRGWTIRNNRFDHVACPSGFRRTVVVRAGSRDVVIANNRMLDSNGNIQLGNDPTSNPARTYSDLLPSTCTGLGINPPQAWGGMVCNNAIAGLDVPPINTQPFDHGIAMWGTCETWVLHNTIVSPGGGTTFDDIEFRFPGTYVHLVNNLLEQAPFLRDSAAQDPTYSASNALYAAETDFVDPHGGDLHLSSTAAETAGVAIDALGMCGTDADGKQRNLAAPTVGAYER
jgi:hypothetical protein